MMSEEKMEHKLMDELLKTLLGGLNEELPGAKTMKYTKKINDNMLEIMEKTIKGFMKENDDEKVKRVDNFCEEIYKLIEEFMKQEEIEGV